MAVVAVVAVVAAAVDWGPASSSSSGELERMVLEQHPEQ